MINQNKIEQIIKNVANQKEIYGVVFSLSTLDSEESFTFSSGNLKNDSRYYVASINKWFINAIILRLINEKKLDFSNHLADFVSKEIIRGLHVIDNQDYSSKITILHLLSQTSGLPCYLSDKPKNGVSGLKELENGFDYSWSIEKVIERTKQLPAHFIPGTKDKAMYIDTGHQLLNLVIENITKKPIQQVLNEMFDELDMKDTIVFNDEKDEFFVFPYMKKEARDIRKFMASINNDVISTTSDMLKFIKTFFNGYFYPKEKLVELEKFKPIFFPFYYGIGLQKFHIPRILSPLYSSPIMLGHCGSTGAIAFYIPKKRLVISGTTNQQANPGTAFRTILKIINALD